MEYLLRMRRRFAGSPANIAAKYPPRQKADVEALADDLTAFHPLQTSGGTPLTLAVGAAAIARKLGIGRASVYRALNV